MPYPDPRAGVDGAGAAMMLHDPADPRPIFRVAVFGLAHKFQRLTEIVLRHARHNRYRFVIAGARRAGDAGEYDIAMVDMTAKGGADIERTLREQRGALPVVRVGRRNDSRRGSDDLLQHGFTLQLLETLNRVVERALLRAGAAPRTDEGRPTAVRVAQAPHRPRALIVDDSPAVRGQLTAVRNRMGVDADSAASAQDALAALARQRYEIAFVDVMMPGVDGFGLTRRIKRDRALRAMPVVILTSRSSPLDLLRGALAGCNCYLVKPVSLQALRQTVARLAMPAGAAEHAGGGLSAA